MGLEAKCMATFGKQSSTGLARLVEKDLYFRGAFRLKIPLREVKSAEARRGVLIVKWAEGRAAFVLGAQAEKWALKIRYPRSRPEKLGVQPGLRTAVLDVEDRSFWRELDEAGTDAVEKVVKDCDLIFLGIEDAAPLKRLRELRTHLRPAGAIWVVWPKGQPHIKEDHVRAAALAAGLVDVKVCAFSDTLSALKLMIPRSRR